MTEKQQPEYIITDDVIHRIIFRLQNEGWKPDEAWLNQTLRSLPHTPAPEHNKLEERECAINNCMRKDWLERHDAFIRKLK